MSEVSRRQIVRALGGILPVGAMAALEAGAITEVGATPAQASPRAASASGPLDEDRVRDVIASIRPAVVLFEVRTERGTQWGSGFLISSDGLAITNRHVVKRGQEVTCLLKNRDKLNAKVVKIDDQYDLALVKVDVNSAAPTVKMGDSDAAHQGLLVGVTGYPSVNWMVYYGVAPEASTSRGSVNGMRYGGDINAFLGDRVLQIDAPVTHGNSGSPVFRLDTGEVIAVLSSGFTGAGNLTFAVPINPAKILISTAGLTLVPNVVAAGTREARVEAGDLRALNTISQSRDLPYLFGQSFAYAHINSDRATAQASRDWETCTGHPPANVTPMTLHDNELFFGGIDGRLRSWDPTESQASEVTDMPVLLDTSGDHQIFLYRPIVTDDMICAVSGELDLASQHKRGIDLGSLVPGLTVGRHDTISVEGHSSIYFLNRRNWSIQQEHSTGFVGTPLLKDNRVYFGGIGVRGCLDNQGKVLWDKVNRADDRPEWINIGYAGPLGVFGIVVPTQAKASPANQGGLPRLYGRDQARIEAYDPADGQVLWHLDLGKVHDSEQPLSTAMVVDEQKGMLYALATHFITAVKIGGIRTAWTYDPDNELTKAKSGKARAQSRQISFTPGIELHDGILYVGSTDRALHAINGADGNTVWRQNLNGTVGHPVYNDGKIIVGSSDNYLQALDAATGNTVWRVRTSSPILSQPLCHNGMVYVGTEDGQIYTVRIPVA